LFAISVDIHALPNYLTFRSSTEQYHTTAHFPPFPPLSPVVLAECIGCKVYVERWLGQPIGFSGHRQMFSSSSGISGHDQMFS